jgi:hypothetical protein
VLSRLAEPCRVHPAASGLRAAVSGRRWRCSVQDARWPRLPRQSRWPTGCRRANNVGYRASCSGSGEEDYTAVGASIAVADTSGDGGPIRLAESLEKAIALAQGLPHVFIVSADDVGAPHVAPARQVMSAPNGHIAIADWFCPTTVANVQRNAHVAIVVWDAERDIGYQLVGQVEEMLDLDMIAGDLPEESETPLLPQIERELVVHVAAVLGFTYGPHSDVPE